MKKLFIFQIDNVIDLITNSSSELFVLSGDNLEQVREMIKSVYPEYLDEYHEVKSISDLSAEELDNYIQYHCSTGWWPSSKSQYPLIGDYTFDELYEPDYDGVPAWNGEIQYRVKNNYVDHKRSWYGRFVTEENRDEVIRRICPKGNLYFLYSIDENPIWEMQENLMQISSRYHLG